MKRCFSRYRLALFAISLASSAVLADQIWRGVSTCDVVDHDLVIKDDVLLPLGGIRIEAIHKDVTVRLTKDVVLSGHWAGESDLYLVAAEGRTIRFELDHNLSFAGSSVSGEPLLIVQSGPGTVEVAIQDGKTFALTSQDCSGGALYYVLMYGGVNAPVDEYCEEYGSRCPDEYACGGLFNADEYGDEYCSPGNGCNEISLARPTLSFVSLLQDTARAAVKNRNIVVGPKSQFGFLSSRKTGVGQDSGIIQFDPATSGTERMILEIQNGGAFVTSGRYTCRRDGGCITLCDIKPTITAGFQAIWRIVNDLGSSVASGLLVLDENETFSELLVDPFLDLGAREDFNNFRGTFCGKQFGVILGANGILSIESDSYLDFVGLGFNQIPCVNRETTCCSININKLVKLRNPSAFIIDGNLNPQATDAQIVFGERAALFVRSGVGADGTIRDVFDMDPFTVDADNHTPGIGNIVFDVEGPLNVIGTVSSCNCITSKIELLSLEVFPTGGSIFVGSGETNFPLRTFNTEDNELLMYNCGAFLINNDMTLFDTALSHTDECHRVCQNNDLRSEPTYVGGETFKLLGEDPRPSIRFINSDLNVNTDIALTGVDLVVPNFVDDFGVLRNNHAVFIFFSNGPCIDNGTGRQMILGTRIGSTAADGVTRIDADAHLDIMQQQDATSSQADPTNDQTLFLMTSMNDDTINNAIVDTEGTSIHTIFLGDSSNISIGVNADSTGFNIDTHPWLRIAGNVFSFAGHIQDPTRSLITGKNAIFVDLNGKFSIDPGFIASICVMVIKSHNGIVDLPADQVFFCEGAGIATWDLNLSDPNDQIIVGPDQALSTFILNWLLAKKDCPNFVPFNCCSPSVTSCTCPMVTEANITSLPTIQGEVDDLQLQGTRIGDPAQFIVDGGLVRQITFLPSGCTAEAPVGVVVLRNDGTVGLDDTTTLGLNGITIIADGSGQVLVNEDLVINNICAIVKGPNFASCDVLEFYSPVDREIRVKSTGTLNLASFTDVTDIVAFAGEIKLVFEPGSTLITGAGTLRFAGNAELLFEPAFNAPDFFAAIPFGAEDNTLPITTVDASQPHNVLSSLTNFGEGLDNTDQFRVRIIGGGTIEIVDNAHGSIPFNAFVGIETIATPMCTISQTDITLNLADAGSFEIGHFNFNQGGVLQIGNVSDLGADHSVSFTLTLDGAASTFSIGSRGFLGLGVGIERFDGQPAAVTRARTCPTDFVPNENIVNTLSNASSITFNFFNGRFEHDRIFSGDNMNASLVAVGDDAGLTFNINFETSDENIDPALEEQSTFNVAGGGNFVLVEPGTGGIQPIVLTQNGMLSDRLTAGIMASTLLQPDNVDQAGLTPTEFYDFMATQDAVTADRDNALGRANVASQGESFRPAFQAALIDTVSQGVIVRGQLFELLGDGQENAKRISAIDDGAAFVNIDVATNEILTASNIDFQE